MATLNQIAYNIMESVGKSDDVALLRRIKMAIKYYRAKLIRQDFERNGLSKDMLQTFIDNVIKVDEADSNCLVIGCTVLRTEHKVPKPVRLKGSLFYRVGTIRLKDPAWKEVGIGELKYQQFNKFTSQATFWYYLNDYIYIITNKKFKYISITGIGADPSEWLDKCVNSADCVSDDEEFPIAADMLDTVLKAIRETELSLQIPEKEINVDAEPR